MTVPAAPLWRMDFADSEVRAVLVEGGDVRVQFSAVSAAQSLPDGQWQAGFVQGLAVRLLQAPCPPDALVASGRLRGGALRWPHRQVSALRQLELGQSYEGPLVLELEMAQGPLLSWMAQGLQWEGLLSSVFRESLAC